MTTDDFAFEMNANGDWLRVHPIPCGLGVGFLIETAHGMYLIDTGTPGNEDHVFAKMKELGRTDLKVIWITHAHYDHYGSAAALRRATGARIGVHPADANYLVRGQSPLGTPRHYGFIYPIAQPVVKLFKPLPPAPPDFTLDDGETLERFGLNATVLHTPGHTPGHTSLVLAGGAAFAADLIGKTPSPRLQTLLATDWEQLPASLAHFQAVQPEWVYTGHSRRPFDGETLQQIPRD